jgi:hypothetical protein
LVKVSWYKKSLTGKSFLAWKVSQAEKYLPRKGFWEKCSSWEKFPCQRNLSLGKVSGKSFIVREISARERCLGKVIFLGKLSFAEKCLPKKSSHAEKCYIGIVFQIV